MRTFIWVLWWCGSNIWCMDIWYYFKILFKSKYHKYMYEKIAYSCPCNTSLYGFWLQSWSSFIPDLYEILYDFEDVVTDIYDLLLCNFMYITYVGQNPRNSCVKSLHSHAIESLVSMTLIYYFVISIFWLLVECI